MDLDAVLSNNLSQINIAVLSNHSNQQESLAGQPGIDEEINYSIAASNSSQPKPINLDSSGLRQSTTMTSQNAHLRSASQRSFSSVCVPFSTICPFGGLSCWVHSLGVKVQVSSTLIVSRHAFALLVFEPITSTKQISLPNTAFKPKAEMQPSADISENHKINISFS
jgi:hypothetical protein